MSVEQHLDELTQLLLNDGSVGVAEEYISTHGINLDELIEAASDFLHQRQFMLRFGHDAEAVIRLAALPAFIIGVMVGLKHGVAEVPAEDFDGLT